LGQQGCGHWRWIDQKYLHQVDGGILSGHGWEKEWPLFVCQHDEQHWEAWKGFKWKEKNKTKKKPGHENKLSVKEKKQDKEETRPRKQAFSEKKTKQDKEETRPRKQAFSEKKTNKTKKKPGCENKTRRPKKSGWSAHISNDAGCDVDWDEDEDEEDAGEQLWPETRDGETLDHNGKLQGLVKDPAEEDSKSNMDSDDEYEDVDADKEHSKAGSVSNTVMQ
jgi:hypothetical protein